MSQINSNLLKKAFAIMIAGLSWPHCISPAPRFTKVLLRHSQKSNVEGIELEKDLSSGFSGFVNFFHLPFPPFVIFSQQWLTSTGIAFSSNISETQAIFYHGIAVNFVANFWALWCISHDLWSGYHWKDFLLHNLMMPILVKDDDVRAGTKTNASHDRLEETRESVGYMHH